MSGLFIDVAIDDSIKDDADLAQKLEDACPVDIYANEDGQVKVVDENLDECVLCELCVKAAPPGAVKVLKLYDGTALESQGAPS
jgi:NAD-dependent dihydropyrimidine dehydrogenase PreA subunit